MKAVGATSGVTKCGRLIVSGEFNDSKGKNE